MAFRRLGTFWAGIGVTMAVGLLLVIYFDFLSILDMPLTGFSDLFVNMGAFGYLLASLLGSMILIVPVDWYYFIWGSGLYKDPDVIISVALLIYFVIIGAFIGFRSTSEDIERPVLESIFMSYLMILIPNIILVIIIYATQAIFIGTLLQAVLQGSFGRSLLLLIISSVLENGTILAVFSSFFATLMSDSNVNRSSSFFCDNNDNSGNLCDFDIP